jgi:hypothetical protein
MWSTVHPSATAAGSNREELCKYIERNNNRANHTLSTGYDTDTWGVVDTTVGSDGGSGAFRQVETELWSSVWESRCWRCDAGVDTEWTLPEMTSSRSNGEGGLGITGK